MKEIMDEFGETPEQKSHISQIYREASCSIQCLGHRVAKAKGTSRVKRSEGSLADPGCSSVVWGKQVGALSLLRRAWK